MLFLDNLVQVHDLNAINFTTIHQVHKSRGATFFAINVNKQTTMTGKISILLRMAVAVKRKIQLYYWKNNEFHNLMTDINLNDIPKSMVWCQEAICVGFRGEYALLDVSINQSIIMNYIVTGLSGAQQLRESSSYFGIFHHCDQ